MPSAPLATHSESPSTSSPSGPSPAGTVGDDSSRIDVDPRQVVVAAVRDPDTLRTRSEGSRQRPNRDPGDDDAVDRRVDLGDAAVRTVGNPHVSRGQSDRGGIRADLVCPNNFVGLRIDALHRPLTAVRHPQRTEAVHQRARGLPDLDGVVQGSVSVENTDAVRWQRGQRVPGLVAQNDTGHHARRGHDRQDDSHDQPPGAQPRSSTAVRRRGSWR